MSADKGRRPLSEAAKANLKRLVAPFFEKSGLEHTEWFWVLISSWEEGKIQLEQIEHQVLQRTGDEDLVGLISDALLYR